MSDLRLAALLLEEELLGGPGSGCHGDNCGRPPEGDSGGSSSGLKPYVPTSYGVDGAGYATKNEPHRLGPDGTVAGKKAERVGVYHNGEKIGHVENTAVYDDTKSSPSSKVVISRREVPRWTVTHAADKHGYKQTYEPEEKRGKSEFKFSGVTYKSKSDAIESLVRAYDTYRKR